MQACFIRIAIFREASSNQTNGLLSKEYMFKINLKKWIISFLVSANQYKKMTMVLESVDQD